jgi:hypothetical protein
MKRPRAYEKKYQYAGASPEFKTYSETIPACLYIHCDEVSLKDAKKIQEWLKKAIKWLEVQK